MLGSAIVVIRSPADTSTRKREIQPIIAENGTNDLLGEQSWRSMGLPCMASCSVLLNSSIWNGTRCSELSTPFFHISLVISISPFL